METKLLEEIEGLRNEIRALGRDFGKIRKTSAGLSVTRSGHWSA